MYTTTLRLSGECITFLAQIQSRIRIDFNHHLDKSAILRALIQGVSNADFDLSAATEEEIAKRLSTALKAPGRRAGARAMRSHA